LIIRSIGFADHYPVEHWLFGRSRTPADDWPPLIELHCVTFVAMCGDRSPPFTDRSLRGRSDSHCSVLRERPPGPVPVTSLPACSSAGAAAGRESSPGELLVPGTVVRARVVRRRLDHSSRVCPGRAVVPAAQRRVVRRGVPASACAVQPLENSKASTSIFVLQATKSQRRMPWRLKPKKDVGDCEKPREAVYQASIRGYPNGATQHLS
jgi:hypothetical protein